MRKIKLLLLVLTTAALIAACEPAATDGFSRQPGTAKPVFGSTSEETQKIGTTKEVTAPKVTVTPETNEEAANGESKKQALKNASISVTECDINGDGDKENVEIVLDEGWFSEDKELWSGQGPKWTGKFSILVKYGWGVIKSYSLNEMMYPGSGDDIFFYSPDFELVMQDYNNDGLIDFNIGQYFSSNGSEYMLFTIEKDGSIRKLPIENRSALFISTRGNSVEIGLNEGVMDVSYYDNTQGEYFREYYKWDSLQKIFKLLKKETLDIGC